MAETEGRWIVGEAYTDDYGNDITPIGPETGYQDGIFSPEDTIAEFWGGEHDAKANAQFVVDLVNGIGQEKAIVDGALEVAKAWQEGRSAREALIVLTRFINTVSACKG